MFSSAGLGLETMLHPTHVAVGTGLFVDVDVGVLVLTVVELGMDTVGLPVGTRVGDAGEGITVDVEVTVPVALAAGVAHGSL